jgi:hypothetical protein
MKPRASFFLLGTFIEDAAIHIHPDGVRFARVVERAPARRDFFGFGEQSARMLQKGREASLRDAHGDAALFGYRDYCAA